MFGFEIWLGKERIVEVDDFYIFNSEEEAQEEANNYIVEELEDGNDYLIVVVEL